MRLVYRFCLRAYPARFRHRHAAEMTEIFAREWEIARDRGLPALLGFGAHIVSDLLRTAPHERLQAMTRREWLACYTATCCGVTAGWVELQAHETTPTLL